MLVIHPIVVEIIQKWFQEWWTDQLTDIAIPRATPLAWLKTDALIPILRIDETCQIKSLETTCILTGLGPNPAKYFFISSLLSAPFSSRFIHNIRIC